MKAEIPGEGKEAVRPAGLSRLLLRRKAITKSGLQHLAPPPPPGAPCGEPERHIRSTVDWSVSGRELRGVGGASPSRGSEVLRAAAGPGRTSWGGLI